MFSVNCNFLYEIYEDWRTALTSLHRCTDEMLAIRHEVNMDNKSSKSFYALFNSCLSELDVCLNQCDYLSQAVDIVCQLYSKCEDQILDYSEGALVVYPPQEPTLIDLSNTEEILKEFSYVFYE